jgi:hypothetical protein
MERRRFVALLSAALCASAGCVGPTGKDGSPARPGSLPQDATAGFGYVDLGDVRAHEALEIYDYAPVRAFGGTPGVRVGEVEEAIAFGERRGTAVAAGRFDASRASTALESDGFTGSGGTNGYTVFEKNDGTAVAVDADSCVRSVRGPSAVRRTVEAVGGDAVTAVDSDDDFAALSDAVGDGDGGTFVTGSVVGDGPVVALGERVDVEPKDTTARVTLVRVFRTEGEAANRTATANATAKRRIRGPVAEADGRTVRVTGEVGVDRL